MSIFKIHFATGKLIFVQTTELFVTDVDMVIFMAIINDDFCYFCTRSYLVGTCLNCLVEAIPKSSHNSYVKQIS